jgi:hypothetical protein
MKRLSSHALVVIVMAASLFLSAGLASAFSIDVKPCYTCEEFNSTWLGEGEDAVEVQECISWVPSDGVPSINLSSKGVTPVQVILEADETIPEGAIVEFAGVPSAFFAYEDVDFDGEEDDLVYYFVTRELDLPDARDELSEATLEVLFEDVVYLSASDEVRSFQKK